MTDDKRGLFISYDEGGDLEVEALGGINHQEALWLLALAQRGLIDGAFAEDEE
jgi:hypothetical protein